MKAVLVKKIDGFDHYYISREGEVMSTNFHRTGRCQVLKPYTNNGGYQTVSLCKNGTVKIGMVHRLVAETFIPNPNNLPCVNHKDENKTNNHVDNLEWCTPKYNCNYGTRNSRMKRKLRENNKHKKQVAQISLDGTIVKIWDSMREAARNGYVFSNIWSCCNHINKTHKNYKWEYTLENNTQENTEELWEF